MADDTSNKEMLQEVLDQVADLREKVEQLANDQERLLGKFVSDEERFNQLQKSAEKLVTATNRLSKVVGNL